MKFYFLFVIALLIGSCSKDSGSIRSEEPAREATALLDLSYGDHPMQNFDLYLPANRSSKTTKVIVLVHGGGWTSGDKKDMNGFVQLLQNSKKDYAIANMNYILANSERKAYPNQIEDLQKLISTIKSRTGDYQILPEFGFIGVSAGAHLSLLYSYAFDMDQEIKMVCSIVGPTDFTDPAYLENPLYADAAPILVEGFDPENQEILEDISPRYQVTVKAPPTLLFYGDSDPLIPNTQHQFLKKSLDDNAIQNNLTVY